MEKKFVNPPALHAARGYTHVITVEGGRRMVFVAGQVALTKEMQLVGAGDLAAQTGKHLQPATQAPAPSLELSQR